MKPYFEEAGIAIYHGDCREVISAQRFEVGAVVTDPPYGHGDRWSGGTWASNPIYELAFRWDKAPVDAGLLSLVLATAPEAIVWGGNYYSLPPSRCWLSWVKTSQMETMADFELAWTNLDRPSKQFREHRNPDGKREHPTQKPESLMRWCLGFVSGKSVLDPFMGSGTTLVAAKRLGKHAIGIDIEEQYCEIAANRLRQGALDLFGEAS